MKVLPIIATAALLLGACTTMEITHPTAEELALQKGYTLGEEVKEIHKYDVSGWQHVSNRALIIPARPSTHYLVTLKTNCNSLDSTEVIGFTTTAGRALTRFDAVVIKERPKSVAQRCYIDKLYRITKIKK